MTDQDTTHQMPGAEPPTEPRPQRTRRLTRSRSDRMLGGVAGGLGEYFGVDALIFRIGFAVSVFFGGLGVIAYLALYLFVPSQRDDGSLARPPIQRSRTLAVAAVALAATAGLSVLALAAAWAGATGSGEVVAGVVIAIGVLLVIAAFRGGARWLIVPALALALPLGAVAAADVSFSGGIGREDHQPATAAAIPTDGYELGIGQLTVDLRELDWTDDTVVELPVDLGIGELRVAVPESVCVTGDFHAAAGAVEVGGDEVGGFGVDHEPEAGTTATPRLVLDASVDLGALRVINDDDADLDRHDRGPFGDGGPSRDDMREAMEAACAPAPERQTPGRKGSE